MNWIIGLALVAMSVCIVALSRRLRELESRIQPSPRDELVREIRRVEKVNDERDKETTESLLDICDRIEEMGGGIFQRRRK